MMMTTRALRIGVKMYVMYTVGITMFVVVAVVVLNDVTVRSNPFGKETVEHYEIANGQSDLAMAFMNDCLRCQTCIEAERKIQRGDNTIIEVTWAYDRDDSQWVPGSDEWLWDFEMIDTSQPLMSHPYFGRNSAINGNDANVLMTEMGACDQAVAMGKTYQLQTKTASALVKIIMQRYAGLRYSGVDEWNPIMLMLSARFRLFPSQLTPSAENEQTDGWSTLFGGVHRVIPLEVINPPPHIKKAIESAKKWTFKNNGSPDPEFVENGFVWVQQKPLVKLSGRNGWGPCDVTYYFLGMQQASKVLYGGDWDPVKTIGGDAQ